MSAIIKELEKAGKLELVRRSIIKRRVIHSEIVPLLQYTTGKRFGQKALRTFKRQIGFRFGGLVETIIRENGIEEEFTNAAKAGETYAQLIARIEAVTKRTVTESAIKSWRMKNGIKKKQGGNNTKRGIIDLLDTPYKRAEAVRLVMASKTAGDIVEAIRGLTGYRFHKETIRAFRRKIRNEHQKTTDS